MTRQRLLGIAALLAIGGLMAGLPWLFLYVATRLRIRFDLTIPEGWWQALTTRDDGTLLVGLCLILGALAWIVLAVAILVEIVNRLRGVRVPQLRGLGIPQAIARGLVAAAIGAWLATNTITTGALHAIAAPGPVPVDTGGASTHLPAAPQAQPETADEDDDDIYVVKKGDTLWDIADDKLGDPHAYPEIFKASKHTVQPDGRRLIDPDLIYPGWELTIPDDDNDKPKPARTTPKRAEPVPTATTAPATAVATVTPAPATPTAAATPDVEPTQVATPTATEPDAESDVDDEQLGGWLLAGLTGGGALLAGGALLLYRSHRAALARARRPGRAPVLPDPVLAPVEKTIRHEGRPTTEVVILIDDTLRRLSQRMVADGQLLPNLVAVDATSERLTLHFTDHTDLPAPFEPDADRQAWTIDIADADSIGDFDRDVPPPWPQLATLGADQAGWHMVNLEALGVVTVTGDELYSEELVRFLLAELAIAPWARDLEITTYGATFDLANLSGRLQTSSDPASIAQLAVHAIRNVKLLSEHDQHEVCTPRVTGIADDLWESYLLVVTDTVHESTTVLTDLIGNQPGRTATAVVRIGSPAPGDVTIEVTSDGRVHVPSLGWNLVVNGLTPSEARGVTTLLGAANHWDDAAPQPIPDPAEPWEELATVAGGLRAEFTFPRTSDRTPTDGASTLLPHRDAEYVTQTANTPDDLARVSPIVPAETRNTVERADPTLDRDLEEWTSGKTVRPRLQVLGTTRVLPGAGGKPTDAAERHARCVEIVAYLATRRHGATTSELADALSVSDDRVRKDLSIVRGWLGTNPRTGTNFLPDATKSPEAAARGKGVYAIEDLLSDADLFRRLRLRGEARGADGLPDLLAALRLVQGAPYAGIRREGGLWLSDCRDDENLRCGIVDVAHLVSTVALHAGNANQALAAARLANLVAPDEDTPLLDIAAAVASLGDQEQARTLAVHVLDRAELGEPGYDPPTRTNDIVGIRVCCTDR